MRLVFSSMRWLFYPQERDPVPVVQKAGWTPWPVRTGAGNIAAAGIRSPDRPVRCVVAILTELSRPTWSDSKEPKSEMGENLD